MAIDTHHRGCDGKVRFDSYAQAAEVAERKIRQNGNKRRCAYHCEYCGKYHVGTPLKPVSARVRRERKVSVKDLENYDEGVEPRSTDAYCNN